MAFPSAALAHRIYEGWIDVWSNGPKCVNEKITQDHGSTSWGYHPHGFWMTENLIEKETNTVPGTINCNTGYARPIDYIKTRVRVMKYDTSTNSWGLCLDTDFIKNDVTTAQWNVKVGTTNASNPPCGDGLYTIIGNASLWWDGAWVGGQLSTSESERME